MPRQTALQAQRRSCLVIALFCLAILILGAVVAGVFLLSPPSIPTTTDANCATIAAGNEQIGISDGCYAFDASRTDRTNKLAGVDKFRSGDTTNATISWGKAVKEDSNDAETLIYLEDQRVRDSGNPYITLVVGITLTGSTSDLSAGHDILQGAYVAQKQYNDGFMINGKEQIMLLIANAGSQATNTEKVAQQIVHMAASDSHIVGVMGWPFSGYTLSAVNTLANAHIPMVSPTASSNKLTGISQYFFRVAPPDDVQAIAGAKYAEQQLGSQTAAIFVDTNNIYSKSLADAFEKQFTTDGGQIVATESYTVGKQDNLLTLLKNALQHSPDLVYFAGYSDDMSVLLTDWPATEHTVQLLGGDALYGLGGYTSSARAGFLRLHFTAFAYPDEWGILKMQEPPFFTIYAQDFDPDRIHASNPYGYIRATNDSILGYDATMTMLEASKNALTSGQALTPAVLRQNLSELNGTRAIQGVSGQISFGLDGNPINKAIVILLVDGDGHIKVVPQNGIQNCFLVGSSNC